MLRLRACPRCKGDLRECQDQYGEYMTCLQCGYHQSESNGVAAPYLPLPTKRGRPRKSASGTRIS